GNGQMQLGFGIMALLIQNGAQIVAGFAEVMPELDRHTVMTGGFVQLALGLQNATESVFGKRGGRDTKRVLILGDGIVQPAFLGEGGGEVGERLVIRWVVLDRLTKMGDGIVDPSLFK